MKEVIVATPAIADGMLILVRTLGHVVRHRTVMFTTPASSMRRVRADRRNCRTGPATRSYR